jgi:Flp pilus assembly pilin Flp
LPAKLFSPQDGSVTPWTFVSWEEMLAQLQFIRAVVSVRALKNNRQGQDMIEYALLAAAVAVIVAGFLPPAIMPMVSTIFSKIVDTFSKSPS